MSEIKILTEYKNLTIFKFFLDEYTGKISNLSIFYQHERNYIFLIECYKY
jgi:hypothetical protein